MFYVYMPGETTVSKPFPNLEEDYCISLRNLYTGLCLWPSKVAAAAARAQEALKPEPDDKLARILAILQEP